MFNRILKKEINLSVLLIIIFYFFILPLTCFCYEHTQTVTITKEDIMNAKPKSPYEIKFDQKDLKDIKMMEKRHFNRTFDELSDEKRLKNLEYELLGRVWEYSEPKGRIKTLTIASTNRMLTGVALPPSISSKVNVKRLRNTSIQMREVDNVGLIDGFLRLISPEKYEIYRKHSDKMFENYY